MQVYTNVFKAARLAVPISRYATDHEHGPGAIVAHSYGCLQQLILSSVANKVVRAAEGPALIGRPPEPLGHAWINQWRRL